VLIAAGSASTPMLSIAGRSLRDTGSTIALLYGNRRTSTVMFADELAELKDRYPSRLSWCTYCPRNRARRSSSPDGSDAAKLRALLCSRCWTSRLATAGGSAARRHGGRREEVLAQHDVPSGKVHRELFYVEERPPPPALHTDAAVTGPASEVHRGSRRPDDDAAVPRTRQFSTPRSEPSGLPFACKGGVCALPGQDHQRNRPHATQLRTRTRRARSRICADLPVICRPRRRLTVDYDG